jgi:hypothetical protein
MPWSSSHQPNWFSDLIFYSIQPPPLGSSHRGLGCPLSALGHLLELFPQHLALPRGLQGYLDWLFRAQQRGLLFREDFYECSKDILPSPIFWFSSELISPSEPPSYSSDYLSLLSGQGTLSASFIAIFPAWHSIILAGWMNESGQVQI